MLAVLSHNCVRLAIRVCPNEHAVVVNMYSLVVTDSTLSLNAADLYGSESVESIEVWITMC